VVVDPDTRRYLGEPDWPAAMLDRGERAVGEPFRGAIQTGAHHYVAELDAGAGGCIEDGMTAVMPPMRIEIVNYDPGGLSASPGATSGSRPAAGEPISTSVVRVASRNSSRSCSATTCVLTVRPQKSTRNSSDP
jgi:hypothetical protein